MLAADRDRAFMGYKPITTVMTEPRTGDQDVNQYGDTVADYVGRFSTLSTFRSYAADETADVDLKWFAMLLLPLGVGCALVKASLQMFGDLPEGG